MSATAAVLGLGLLMGMQHATEADHLAAVATLVGRERSLRRGLRHGVAWGVGHTAMLLCVAGGVGLLGWVISPQLAGRFEQIVGVMLVALGLNLAWRVARERARERVHVHVHVQGHGHAHAFPLRTVLVGMVHGLAGSAALALLVSQTMPSPLLSLAYISLFGIGSIAGMALLSGVLVLPMGLVAQRMGAIHRALNLAVAAFSIVLGARLLMGS
jgi:hypothetical protein